MFFVTFIPVRLLQRIRPPTRNETTTTSDDRPATTGRRDEDGAEGTVGEGVERLEVVEGSAIGEKIELRGGVGEGVER